MRAGVLAVAATAAAAALSWFAARSGGAAFAVPQAHRAANVALRAANGRALHLASGPRIVVFGYIGCADRCPLTLRTLSEANVSDPRTAAPRVTFVDIDPWNDTPADVRAYVAHFPHVEGATGDAASLAASEAALGMMPVRSPADVPAHDARIFLLDRDGIVVAALRADVTPQELRAALGAFDPAAPRRQRSDF